MEEWKVVEGFSRYKVSDLARVWDTQRDVEVAQMLSGIPQYYYVNMQRDDGERKLVRVHRLVAKAFVEGETEEFCFVDHIDRNKLNNTPSNLRWVDRKGNARNLESNIYIRDVLLKDFVLNYESPDAAYIHISASLRNGLSEDESLDRYHKYLKYGGKLLKIMWDDEEVYLLDLCKEYGKDYQVVATRLYNNYPIWNALYGIPESYQNSFEILDDSGVGHWYRDSSMFTDTHLGCMGNVRELLLKGKSLDEILNYDGKDHIRITVNGVTGTRDELCRHFGKSRCSVDTRVQKGMTFEEALSAPPLRVKKVNINGVRNSPKHWYEHFGLDYKKVKQYKDRSKCSFEEALIAFGIDTSEMEITYGDY